MNPITSNTADFSKYISGAVNNSGRTYSRPKYEKDRKVVSIKDKKVADSQLFDIPPLIHSWKSHLNLNNDQSNGKWRENASIPYRNAILGNNDLEHREFRKTILPKYFLFWVDAVHSTRNFYSNCENYISRIQRKRIVRDTFLDWHFAFKSAFSAQAIIKYRLKRALIYWSKYVGKHKFYVVAAKAKLTNHFRQLFLSKLKLLLFWKRSRVNNFENYVSIKSQHEKQLLLSTMNIWRHHFKHACRSKFYVAEETYRKQKIKNFLETLSAHHTTNVKKVQVHSMQQVPTKQPLTSNYPASVPQSDSVKLHKEQRYRDDIAPPPYESMLSKSKVDMSSSNKIFVTDETDRKERLSWFRKQAQDRISQRRKDEETITKERKLKEDDAAARLLSEERQKMIEKRQKNEKFLKAESSQQRNQLALDKLSKSNAFYEKTLLIRCGMSPWLKLIITRRKLVELATNHHLLSLKRNSFSRLAAYSVYLRTERIRREFRLGTVANQHYSCALLRKIFKLFHSRLRILRAKANVVSNHLSRIHQLRRCFLGWKIAQQRLERRQAKVLKQVSYISEKSVQKYFFNKWISLTKINRVEREIEYRTNQKWSTIKSMLRK